MIYLSYFSPIRLPKKHFQWINTFVQSLKHNGDKRQKQTVISFCKTEVLRYENLNFLHPRILCAKVDWNGSSGSGEDFLSSSMYLCSFLLSSFRKTHLFEQTWFLFTQGFFMTSLVKIGPMVVEKMTFIFRHCTFAIISPWNRIWPFILQTQNILYTKILCVKAEWNKSNCSGGKWRPSDHF